MISDGDEVTLYDEICCVVELEGKEDDDNRVVRRVTQKRRERPSNKKEAGKRRWMEERQLRAHEMSIPRERRVVVAVPAKRS